MKNIQYIPAFHEAKLKELIKNYIPCKKAEIVDEFVYIHSDKGVNKIHWFQFCLTILAEKVIMYNAQKVGDLAYMAMIDTVHPIDFLYGSHKQKIKDLKKINGL